MNEKAKGRTSRPVPGKPRAPGRREQNKSEKLERIKTAARELFEERTFDDATTREIALRAGVGMGTLFLYADNKRDLLFLIANDELAAITETSTARAAGASVKADFMALFRTHYAYFGRRPELSRSMLREMTFYDTGKQARRFQTIRTRVLQHLADIARAGQKRGELRRQEDPAMMGWIAFCIYQVELRRWLLEEKPQLRSGLRRLEQALELYLGGIRN